MGALDDYNEEYKQRQRERIIDLELQNARLKKYIKDRSRYVRMLKVRERHVVELSLRAMITDKEGQDE